MATLSLFEGADVTLVRPGLHGGDPRRYHYQIQVLIVHTDPTPTH